MLRTVIVGSAFALAAIGLQQPGQQPGFPRPTLDTGPVHVEGSVQATQEGTWSVNVAALPAVSVATLPAIETASPDFVIAGHTYLLTSSAGVEIQIRVTEVRRGGWVRGVQPDRKAAWYNLSQFQTVADSNEPRP